MSVIGNMKTTIHLEALSLAKTKILEHLKGKVRRIKFLYAKEDITEADVKRINVEDEHIRAVINFVEDAYTTIAAIQEENQMLRLRCEKLGSEKVALIEAAKTWKKEYQNSMQQYQDLITVFQKFHERNEAA